MKALKVFSVIASITSLLVSIAFSHALASPGEFLQCQQESKTLSIISSSTNSLDTLCQFIPQLNWQSCSSSIVNKLVKKLELKENPILDITIIENTHPDAFLVNRQRIVLSSGILAHIDNYTDLAFILAHELGHLLLPKPLKELNNGTERLHVLGKNNPVEELEADRFAQWILKLNAIPIFNRLNLLDKIALGLLQCDKMQQSIDIRSNHINTSY
jgi:Peptidase family M48